MMCGDGCLKNQCRDENNERVCRLVVIIAYE